MFGFHSVISAKTPIGSLNPERFYSDKIHLVKKGNSKLSKSICKSIEDFYDTGNINRYQLTISYKTAMSFVLSNADCPSLSTVSIFNSTSINTDTFFEDCSSYI